MTDHYYSKNPQSKSSPKTWQTQIKKSIYTFTSDVGVFSKNEIDFGSRLLIEAFELPNVHGDLLDLGCGYGPIGVVLADQYKDRTIVMADINERALTLAEKNAQANGCTNTIIKKSDGYSGVRDFTFASILVNPPIRAGKKVVHQMLEESKNVLTNGGELWVVIQKKQGAPSAQSKMKETFKNVTVVTRKKGYYILKSIKVD